MIIDFLYDQTRIRSDVLSGSETIIGGSNHRLGEIQGVIDNDGPGHKLAVPVEVFRQFRLIASWHSVTPDPSLFQMRRDDFQGLAFPGSSRKALPRVGGELVRMRPSIKWFSQELARICVCRAMTC